MPDIFLGSGSTAADYAAPIMLPPVRRFAGDDWTLAYIAWDEPPLLGPDGVTPISAGVVRVLTGCQVIGSLRYQTRCGSAPAPISPGQGLITATGAIVGDPTASGTVSLSLPATQTAAFPRQDPSLWNGGNPDPRRALFISQPRVIDANGITLTVGLEPIFVF